MSRQEEIATRRLRRLARALVHDSESADALVLETLAIVEGHSATILELFAVLVAQRRARDAELAYRMPRSQHVAHPQPDILRALEQLSLAEREVLALALVEQMPYEDAAAVLKMSTDVFVKRLTQAREALARVADGERRVVLRLVK
ncbi:sigma factor-like helix-turn-helix DNA-binding protein [Labrys wisconsinensis]|uniref:DNA-directed RNA polymerase specialized sigma24 family protein n=1 Tax=Labrys wisconsinensis TaxID=425677 RepID=A0ABU0J8P7_9HYPH|nr:sigma factor-like helix-turn-helix DNA-binding protein [Labrys wisconsinensis]MDQ0470647.1 DNA-directed RNA polymerase specialized sigma24 family protein [Labrys wisconsinensis]